MTTQIKHAPVRRPRSPKVGKLTRPGLTEPNSVSGERTPDGRFAKNNSGGPGNPHARHCARMLALLRASISDEEMVSIIRMLVEKAQGGDVSAAKLIMSYKLGKPGPAPNPDEIDRNEWEHFQRDTIKLDEVQQVLGSLPARVWNDIARAALPVIGQARREQLACQLVENTPDTRKLTEESDVASKPPRGRAPISNGDTSEGHDAALVQSASHDQRSTTNDPPPIPNGKSKQGGSKKVKSKKLKPEWLRQMAGRVGKRGRR
jgi:hypothetical protein